MKTLKAQDSHCEALKALAHIDRLRTFLYLVKAKDETHVGAIQAALDLPGATLSRHLDVLTRAGLLARRKEERFIFYRINRPAVSEIVRLLTACC